ncbi:MAG: glycoside hydrolase family 20 zincin-like fold domain-containing protein [Anaerolineae bacterium]
MSAHDQPDLLPQPQTLRWLPGVFSPTAEHALYASAESADSAALRALAAVVGAGEARPRDLPAGVFALVSRPDEPPVALQSPAGDEAYALRVDEKGIVVAANSPAGAFYAAQTLKQLRTDGGFACAEVLDRPDLAVRGIHLDLKGCMPTFEYLIEWVQTLASLKLNCLLVEYEDKFPYRSHPAVVAPSALTPDELDRFIKVARDNYVEIVPLVQCFGHVEYVLRHEEYADLREAGHHFQFCPLQPGSMKVFEDLAREVVAAHPDSRFFHLGADEAWALGECPRCRDFSERESKFALYVNYVREACNLVTGLGVRPIIWDDMVWREDRPELVQQIPENVVLCDWFYHTYDQRVRIFPFDDHMYISGRWLEAEPSLWPWQARRIEDLPPHGVEFARRYWDKGEWPLWGDALPYVDYYKDIGRDVIGASAARGATEFWSYVPGHEDRYRNVAFWARAARDKGIMGVFNTAWSRYNGALPPCEPLELCWHPIAAAAELDWHADTERADYDAKFGRLFLGSAAAAATIRALDAGGGALEAPQFDSLLGEGGRATYRRHLLTARDLKRLWRDAGAAIDGIRARSYQIAAGTVAAEEIERMRAQGRALLESIAAWRQQALPVLSEGLLPEEAQEVVDTQTAGLERELRCWLDQIH